MGPLVVPTGLNRTIFSSASKFSFLVWSIIFILSGKSSVITRKNRIYLLACPIAASVAWIVTVQSTVIVIL